jgi:hypothetical protein
VIRAMVTVALPCMAIFSLAFPAMAQSNSTNYIFLLASGFLCDPGDSSTLSAHSTVPLFRVLIENCWLFGFDSLVPYPMVPSIGLFSGHGTIVETVREVPVATSEPGSLPPFLSPALLGLPSVRRRTGRVAT